MENGRVKQKKDRRGIGKKLLCLLWPTVCVFCGAPNSNGICERCKETEERLRIRQPVCMKCGRSILSEEKEYCRECEGHIYSFEQGAAVWKHVPPVSTSIYRFKYKNQRAYAEIYGRELAKNYKELLRQWKIDYLVPIPIHHRRKKARGYNQSELLTKELEKYVGIPVLPVLERGKNTIPQKRLTAAGRRKNLKEAFRITAGDIRGRNLLLVDDIYTTGSTMEEASRILRKSGAGKVFFLTLSIGQYN